MNLVDANVLLYAVDLSAKDHAVAKAWLDRALSGHETVLMPWICLLAFLRISTHPGIYPDPVRTEQALDLVAEWRARRNVVVPAPGRDHLATLRDMLVATGTGGNLVNDAHLAAMALEHDATVVTFDNDFARFPGVRWRHPGDA